MKINKNQFLLKSGNIYKLISLCGRRNQINYLSHMNLILELYMYEGHIHNDIYELNSRYLIKVFI